MGVVVGALVIALIAPQSLVEVREDGPAIPAEMSFGDEGAWVETLNIRLVGAGFHADDGSEFGRQTRHAVYAFQKHHGLDTTGVFTPEMWDLLDEPIALPYRPELDRVEIDLAKQVLYLVEGGDVTLVLPISSGSGGTYRHSSGGWAVATTPEGRYAFDRKIDGWRHAFLGSLYNPFYFKGGFAIHGSKSVPNHPASHGCVRVTMWDMDLLKTRIEIGWPVFLYGKRTERPAPMLVESPSPEFV